MSGDNVLGSGTEADGLGSGSVGGSPFADGTLPFTDNPSGGESTLHQSVSGIDITGATISQEWSFMPQHREKGKLVRLNSRHPPHAKCHGQGWVTNALTSVAYCAGNSPLRRRDAPSILLPHQSEYVSHIALDIGGSLIKLVYFSRDPLAAGGGKLHFVKFETTKVDECIDFIEAKGLHRHNSSGMPMRVKATGGGAYKYAEVRWFTSSIFTLSILPIPSHACPRDFLPQP